MTIFNQVQTFANEWESRSHYVVSGSMVVAVVKVIQAADPHGVSTDDAKFIKEMTFKILNAALVPENEKSV